jgi:hypothetical protein
MAERNADVPSDRRIEFRMGINVGDIIKDGARHLRRWRQCRLTARSPGRAWRDLRQPGGARPSARQTRLHLRRPGRTDGQEYCTTHPRSSDPLRRGDGHPLPPGLTTGNDASALAARQAFRGSVALYQHERRPRAGVCLGWHSRRRHHHFVARISSRAKSAPRICIYERRRYSGRPSSNMRFSEATAMATSVVCRPSVCERSASPITRL